MSALKIKYFLTFAIMAAAAGIHAQDPSNLSAIKLQLLTGTPNNLFYISDIKVNWRNAVRLCGERGLQLLTILTPADDTAFQNILQDRGSFSVWTGLNDIQIRSIFVWETTKTTARYANWRNGFPYKSSINGCVSVSNAQACGRKGTYGWDKQDCNTYHYAVCHNILSA